MDKLSHPLESGKFSNISPVPGIKDNVGSKSHHPFGRVDISEKTKQKLENNESVCEGRAGP